MKKNMQAGDLQMKVIINGDFLAMEKSAGVGRYATEIIKELDKVPLTNQYECVMPTYAIKSIKLNNIKPVRIGNRPLLLWKNFDLPRYVNSNKGLLVDLTQAFPFGIKGITCVHDCMPELSNSSYKGFLGKTIRRGMKLLQRRNAIQKNKLVITVSENSKKDIIEIYKISPSKIVVIGNAWQHINEFGFDDSILEKYGLLENSYCFSLGSKVPHKNIEWVVAAARQNPNLKFVVSGENDYCKEIEGFGEIYNMIFTGYIPDEQIKSLMLHCKAFIYPSIYEGFGIPPMEALALGKPAIVSNSSCLPEIYQESVHYIDPHERDGIYIDKILEDEVKPAELVLGRYSWKKSAEELEECIRNASGS